MNKFIVNRKKIKNNYNKTPSPDTGCRVGGISIFLDEMVLCVEGLDMVR